MYFYQLQGLRVRNGSIQKLGFLHAQHVPCTYCQMQVCQLGDCCREDEHAFCHRAACASLFCWDALPAARLMASVWMLRRAFRMPSTSRTGLRSVDWTPSTCCCTYKRGSELSA